MLCQIKVLMSVLMSALLTISCGSGSGNLRSIDESPDSLTSVQSADKSPFHSYSGWQSPVVFYVEDAAGDHIVEASARAAASWNDEVGHAVLDLAGTVATSPRGTLYSSLGDDITVVFHVSNWLDSTGKATTTLATTVWENADNSDRIVKGDILLNGEHYLYTDAMSVRDSELGGKSVVDSETVLLHEFGHLLGLEHVGSDQDPESVMHAKTFIGPRVTARRPSLKDAVNLRTIYPQ